MYTQVKPFVVANAGTTKYLCLANVRLGYGISALYLTATKAWKGTLQHPDRNFPAGCAVPVFWSLFLTLDGVYEDYGHVAVRLADGRIWTDGRYYNSVDELNSSYLGGKGKYLGWGETLNNVTVVKPQEVSMAETINDDVSRQIGFHQLGRNGKDGRPNALDSRQNDIYGKPLTNAQMSAFFLSAESQAWRDVRLQKVYAERDALKNEVASLKKQLADAQMYSSALEAQNKSLQAQLTAKSEEVVTLQNKVTELEAANKKLKEELLACGSDTVHLNALGKSLQWLVTRLGLKG